MSTTENSLLFVNRMRQEAALLQVLSNAFDRAVADFGEARLAKALVEEVVEA